jgi:CheY-like chemotaxis protein
MARTVVVVDDENEIRDTLAEFLVGEGYEVICARDGGEATTKLAHVTPHVILLDVLMPVMNGYEVLDWIRANAQLTAVPVVAMSGTDKAPAGSTEFLQKPFSPQALLAAIEAVCSPVSGSS